MEPTENTYRVFFAVPAKVQILDLTGPAQVFQEARQLGAQVELTFLALEPANQVSTNTDLTLAGLKHFSEFELYPADLLFIPGVLACALTDPSFVAARVPFYKWLLRQREQGAILCGVCTGAYLLAQAGLLDGLDCTTHWKYFNDFRERFSNSRLLKNRLFVESEGIFTSAGVTSGIDLSLHIVHRNFGARIAANVAREIVLYYRRGPDDEQMNAFLKHRNHLDNAVHDVQDYILVNLDRKVNISELAMKVGMSTRNLTRKFKLVTGLTLQDYTDELRLERARKLLSEGQKVQVVATSCGYRSTNALRSLFLKKQGVLPSGLSQ